MIETVKSTCSVMHDDGVDELPPVICLDGPSGSGKGTVARAVAAALGFHFLDSGALYRVVAFAALQANVDSDDEPALLQLVNGAPIFFYADDHGDMGVRLDGLDVTAEIRAEPVGNCASRIAAHPGVRSALLERQRACRTEPGLVADGRDMGTVVFPDAALKIFLTATARKRAERRHKQLKQKGIAANITQLYNDIIERDTRDFHRAVAPLRPAEDAITIDASEAGVAQVVANVLDLARKRL